jgi:transcriptional regulator with AAA-type ATPase domain
VVKSSSDDSTDSSRSSSGARHGSSRAARRRGRAKRDLLYSSRPLHEDSTSDDSDRDAAARPAPAVKPFVGVAGLEAHLKSLEEMVLLPLKEPALFASLGVKPPRGVLFHGPPGTGKTLLARQLADACSAVSRKPLQLRFNMTLYESMRATFVSRSRELVQR